jgi:RyR domain
LRYEPQPINTSGVGLGAEVRELTELLARNAHDNWARQRVADGWRFGPERNDQKKEHPCLIPYDELPEAEKEYDRKVATETLKAILALGYRIVKA